MWIFERFETPKPVGSGLILQPTGLGVLTELGLLDRITVLGARIEILNSIHSTEQLTFAQYDHFTAAKPYSDRLVRIGDACRATSPQLGQGANMALLDALALAKALQLNCDLADALECYAHMRRYHDYLSAAVYWRVSSQA